MDNPFIGMIGSINKPAYKILEEDLAGIVSNSTFYNLLDESGIPAKTQWQTVESVARALGYRVVFVKNDSNT
jgi:hypothetical protein